MIEYDRLTVYALGAAFNFINANYEVNAHGSLIVYEGKENNVVLGRFSMPYAITINEVVNNIKVSKLK